MIKLSITDQHSLEYAGVLREVSWILSMGNMAHCVPYLEADFPEVSSRSKVLSSLAIRSEFLEKREKILFHLIFGSVSEESFQKIIPGCVNILFTGYSEDTLFDRSLIDRFSGIVVPSQFQRNSYFGEVTPSFQLEVYYPRNEDQNFYSPVVYSPKRRSYGFYFSEGVPLDFHSAVEFVYSSEPLDKFFFSFSSKRMESLFSSFLTNFPDFPKHKCHLHVDSPRDFFRRDFSVYLSLKRPPSWDYFINFAIDKGIPYYFPGCLEKFEDELHPIWISSSNQKRRLLGGTLKLGSHSEILHRTFSLKTDSVKKARHLVKWKYPPKLIFKELKRILESFMKK